MFVSLTGLFLDWVITRNWKAVSCLLVPFGLLALVLTFSFLGTRISQDWLAQQYVNAGQKELDEIPDWAFSAELSEDEQGRRVSRFTEAMFYRAQRLKPGDPWTIFVIGRVLEQRGAKARALSIMESLAPDKSKGFVPAHAWMAYHLLRQPDKSKEEIARMRHHLDLGITWEYASAQLLTIATRLALMDKQEQAALELMMQTAEKEEAYEGELLRLALRLGNKRVAEQTAKKAQPRLEGKLVAGTQTVQDLVDLADIYFYQKQPARSAKVLEEGLVSSTFSADEKKVLRLALSELYRLQFNQSLKVTGDNWAADVRLLDQAMRIDPTNRRVAETVAMLARISGERPPELLMKQLNKFLSAGTATPITHAWIAEAHILRQEYSDAIQHLESVLVRMPEAPHTLNNLAYAIALERTEPPELEKALTHVNRAIALLPSVADFYDTKGFVLSKLGQDTEAITALESAVERDSNRPDFHDRLAILYADRSPEIAQAHRERAKQLRTSEGGEDEVDGEVNGGQDAEKDEV